MERIASFPVFLILTYRVGYKHPFGSRSYLRQISLNRFPDRESKRIIQTLIPEHRLGDDFIQLVLDKADGNPLYLEEIIKSLIERNIILKDPVRYKLTEQTEDIEIPETIQEIILARVDRLEEHSKMTIQAASVIGREFTLKLLARQEELERQSKQYIKELKQLELVREKSFFPDIEYIFKNAVTKDVVYNSLLLKKRKELHRRTAEAIERLYWERKDDYLEMLAYHYLHSDAIDKAISYLVEAGEKAKLMYANNEAIEYFQEALEIARRSRGTPRIANRLLRRVRDFADVKGDGNIDLDIASSSLKSLEVDERGLDAMDRELLRSIIEKFDGGPVGLDTLAACLSEERDTIEEVYEPYLLQLGFLERTPRGRQATRLAYEHLGKGAPNQLF